MNESNKLELSDKLVWVDIETTGINDYDYLLEIAVIITDNELNEIDFFHSPILDIDPMRLNPNDNLGASDIFCWPLHFVSGLVDELIKLDVDEECSLTSAEVEILLIDFLWSYGISNENEFKAPLCGSSVHFDRAFLQRIMPNAMSMLHYRNIDVSSVRECAKRWCINYPSTKPEPNHRALSDIRSSIELARHFKEYIFESCSY